MNILFVDDNPIVLEGMTRGLDFEKIGIDKVFTATSADEARNMLRQVSCQIVVADIEMPGENGLSLLEWINGFDSSIVTIFCTSYADFNYARKAVSLHSFDYFLKPVDYHALTELLTRAAKEAQSRHAISERREYAEYWADDSSNRLRDFWFRLLYAMNEFTPEETMEEVRARHLPYTLGDLFILVILRMDIESGPVSGLTPTMEEFVLVNILNELLENHGLKAETVFRKSDNEMIFILKDSAESPLRPEECFHQIISVLSDQLMNYCNIYYRALVPLTSAAESIGEMEEWESDDIHSKNTVQVPAAARPGSAGYDLSEEMAEMEAHILAGRWNDLQQYIHLTLHNILETKDYSRKTLSSFGVDVKQVLYSVLREKHINAHELFCQDEAERLQAISLRSARDLEYYLNYLINESQKQMEFSENKNALIRKVLVYIDENYTKEITRQMLGDLVCLNPVYLSRLFKEYTGQPIYNYIVDRRIRQAKVLLSDSSAAISDVAAAVGYDNYSYFSRIFKEKTGLSPKEYQQERTA